MRLGHALSCAVCMPWYVRTPHFTHQVHMRPCIDSPFHLPSLHATMRGVQVKPYGDQPFSYGQDLVLKIFTYVPIEPLFLPHPCNDQGCQGTRHPWPGVEL